MAQNPQEAPTGLKEELLAALCCLYYWLWTTFVERLKVSTGFRIGTRIYTIGSLVLSPLNFTSPHRYFEDGRSRDISTSKIMSLELSWLSWASSGTDVVPCRDSRLPDLSAHEDRVSSPTRTTKSLNHLGRNFCPKQICLSESNWVACTGASTNRIFHLKFMASWHTQESLPRKRVILKKPRARHHPQSPKEAGSALALPCLKYNN
ncbi:uncharacterized protein LOC118017089 [Mirounga leonina]|uniref:uncharacterized protein LOC118017089 n=1 Tax=Mirounga leonina TaxID=9715 RepID=UPI00156C4A28|nr:uncharacterized protein LOC118017089 [Mirounga leonina]